MDEKNTQIQQLRQEVINMEASLSANTSEIGDYKIIKCYEATLTDTEAPYDIKDLTAKRQAVRDKINEVEAEIAKLEAEAASETAEA